MRPTRATKEVPHVPVTRRALIVGASASLVAAPAIVRYGSLRVRGVVVPVVPRVYYGFAGRLWIDHG